MKAERSGARALLETLVAHGVTTCFTNPGTSEMHFVAALDSVPEMHAVLTLFEGVATGAADGFARMSGQPGATLLHLGPGLANGLANLHNARRAHSPVITVVGDHAADHLRFDAPLQSDIETIARNVSGWVRTNTAADLLPLDAAEAIARARAGEVTTLIVPADSSWSRCKTGIPSPVITDMAPVPEPDIDSIAARLRASGNTAAILLGADALSERGIRAAAQIAAATGARILAETFPARMSRGAGLPPIDRLAYLPELASIQLRGVRNLILVGAPQPTAFFAYPGARGELAPHDCRITTLVPAGHGGTRVLEVLRDLLGAKRAHVRNAPRSTPRRPNGALTAATVCRTIGRLLPENAIVSDEAQTSGATLPNSTQGSPPHDWLALTGGAIGQGLPVAIGAAVACPDRPVIALQADGSAAYTIQSLWTMARESLDITVVLFNNHSYAILEMELARVGAGVAGPRARNQLDLSKPTMDFVDIGNGFGVPSVRARDVAELESALKVAIAEPGPHLIEVCIDRVLSGRKLAALPRLLKGMQALPAPAARYVKNRMES